MLLNLQLISVCLIGAFASGCSSMGGKSGAKVPNQARSISVSQPVVIEFKGKPGASTETRYYSNARILSYQDGQLLRDRTESVDFTVNTQVTAYDDTAKVLQFEARTVRKDGVVALHDYAFPELNEKIEYVVRGSGEVLKAGRFTPQSLFFVPALPIPDKPVSVGDTWSMEHTWYSAKEGIPLKLEVVGILKNLVKCEGSGVCADVEVSGRVALVAQPTAAGARFESRLWGRMLFSLERGDVVWSEMRSQEEMGVKSDRLAVSSCMVSESKLAAEFKTDFVCEPGEKPILFVPQL